MEGAHPALTITLALAAGVLAQSLARHLRVPGIVVLLVAGVGLGPDGLGWVRPSDLGNGLFLLVDLAVAVVLFEGGLNLEISRLRREQAAIRRLITFGALVTLMGGALAAHFLLGWDWVQAFLFGSLVVVTGPTVIGPLASELRLRPKVGTVLEAEGVLIDPIGAILAVLVLELALSPDPESLSAGATDFVLRFGFGVAAGVAAGFALGGLLRIRGLLPEGHENVFVLAAVLLLFQSCEEVVRHSGILAIAVSGVVVGNMGISVSRDLREFKDQLSILLVGLLFVMLAADVRFEHVRDLGWPGIAVLAALVLVVRPVGVWLSTLGSELSVRERAFIGWIAPRGIVAAAVASLVVGTLENSPGMASGPELRAMVFLTIAGTVLLAGFTAGPVGTWLGVRQPGRDTYAILGAHALGFALAADLKRAGVPVVFIDANPQSCREAEGAGFQVVFGNALEERTLVRARFGSVAAVVALTPNQTVNSVFVGRARERFGVPRGYVAAQDIGAGLVSEMVEHKQAEVAFDGAHDVERWEVRSRRNDLEIGQFAFTAPDSAGSEEAGAAKPDAGERYVILTVRRGARILPMSLGYQPREGDVASVALHVPERDEALARLADLGWHEVPDEDSKTAAEL